MDLSSLRKEIDRIDGSLTELLGERFELSEEIAKYKKENGLPVFDAERERLILDRAYADGGKALRAVFSAILDASKEEQRRIIGE